MRFFFDENFSPRIVRALGCLADTDGDIAVPLRDKFTNGIDDEDYIEVLCAEGNWVVATLDPHIVRKPHILKAWQSAGLVVLFFRGSWPKLGFWGMAWKLVKRWPELRERTAEARQGTIIEVPVSGSLRRHG